MFVTVDGIVVPEHWINKFKNDTKNNFPYETAMQKNIVQGNANFQR